MSPDRRLRVLSVIKGLGVGGAERLLVDQLEHRDRSRFVNHVAYLLPWKDLVVPDLEAAEVEVTCLDADSVLRASWVARLLRLVARFDPDVVHVHSPVLAAVVRPLLRLRAPGVALVYTEHNRWGQYRAPTRWANRLTYGLDDAHVAVSEGVVASVPEQRRPGMEVILNGIDVGHARAAADRAGVRAELGVDEDTVVVVTVANLRSSKDYPNVLRAAARVVAERDDVLFLSVGQGPDRDEIQQLHEQLGLGRRYRFLGFRRDAVRVVSGCDVFLLGSRHEGFPLALMEAMALGVPVVATAVGGIPEAVNEGVHGRLVRPHDPEALASALLDVVGDQDRRRSMGEAARHRSDGFDSIPAIRRLEALYGEVADARTPRASSSRQA